MMIQDDGNTDQRDTGWFFNLGVRAQLDLAGAGGVVGRKRLAWERRLEAWL